MRSSSMWRTHRREAGTKRRQGKLLELEMETDARIAAQKELLEFVKDS